MRISSLMALKAAVAACSSVRSCLAVLAVVCVGASNAQTVSRSDPGYAQSLRAKYASRIKFETAYSRRVVEDFAIDCQARDGRSLPLMNVMLAKVDQLDGKDGYLTSRVDSRGEDVRVFDEWVEGGRVVDSRLAFEINKWGELRTLLARPEAIRNACFGSYGHIWVSPISAQQASASVPKEASRQSTPQAAAAPRQTSFDCAKAKSVPEKLICSDDELAALDLKLSGVFAAALKRSSDPAALRRAGAAAWKQRESQCIDKQCLVSWFNQRLEALR